MLDQSECLIKQFINIVCSFQSKNIAKKIRSVSQDECRFLEFFFLEKKAQVIAYRNNSIYWDTVCIGTHSFLKKIIILTIILIGTY